MLVGIAASGRTPYVLGAVAEARRLGAVTIGVSCTPESELAHAVDIAITPAGGPGSGRRIDSHEGRHGAKAGTEHALYSGVRAVGFPFHGNLMVNVQPKNGENWWTGPGASSHRAAAVSYERAGELA